MGLCGEQQVGLSFLTENGRFLARVVGPVSGNVLLRREQYRRADDLNASGLIARSIVTAKVANCRVVLQRALRDRVELQQSGLPRATADLQASLQDLTQQNDLDAVRGVEGSAANTYFGVFDHLINARACLFRLQEPAPVGERIWGNVDHAHECGAAVRASTP